MEQHKSKLSLILILSTFIFLIPNTFAGDWTTLGNNDQRVSWTNTFVPDYSAETGYDRSLLIKSITLDQLAGETSPIIKDNIMYINGYNDITAINLTSIDFDNPEASILWSFPHNTTGITFSTPAIVGIPEFDDSIICYGEEGAFTCRLASNGQEIWGIGSYIEPGVSFGVSSPVIDMQHGIKGDLGIVWAGSQSLDNDNPALYGFDLFNGDVCYRFDSPQFDIFSPNQIVNSPTIHTNQSILYFTVFGESGTQGNIYALSYPDDGPCPSQLTELWSYDLPPGQGSFFFGSPTIKDNKLFTVVWKSSGTSYLLALNNIDGSELWRYNITDSGFRPTRPVPSPFAGKIIFSASTNLVNPGETIVYAIDENDGSLVWKSDVISSGAWSSPSIADSKVLIGTVSEQCILNSGNGSIIWTETFENDHYGFSTMVDDTTYTLDSGGVLKFYNTDNKHEEPLPPSGAGAAPSGIEQCSWGPNPPPQQGTFCIEGKANADTEINVKFFDHIPPSNTTGVENITVTKFLDVNDLDLDGGSGSVQTDDGTVQLNKFIDVDVEGISIDEINNNLEWADIRIYYTDDELWTAGIVDESLLRIYSWNTTNQSWEELDNSGVNQVKNYVHGRAYHFSEFGGGSVQLDSDNDTVFDIEDNCIADHNPGQEDSDGEGIGDVCDVCPLIQNGAQEDLDGDGEGDVCDADIDNDGFDNNVDLCPFDETVPSEDASDTDNDFVGDSCDVCPNVADPFQWDTDQNGTGNLCDNNDDGDPFLDIIDTCPLIFSSKQINTGDSDNDGIDNFCDFCPGNDATGQDVNFDGCPDAQCTGDIIGDGNVGITDFLFLLASWGPQEFHPADLNGDFSVGIVDFLALLANWGSCTAQSAQPLTFEEQKIIQEALKDHFQEEEYDDVVREFRKSNVFPDTKKLPRLQNGLAKYWLQYNTNDQRIFSNSYNLFKNLLR